METPRSRLRGVQDNLAWPLQFGDDHGETLAPDCHAGLHDVYTVACGACCPFIGSALLRKRGHLADAIIALRENVEASGVGDFDGYAVAFAHGRHQSARENLISCRGLLSRDRAVQPRG